MGKMVIFFIKYTCYSNQNSNFANYVGIVSNRTNGTIPQYWEY